MSSVNNGCLIPQSSWKSSVNNGCLIHHAVQLDQTTWTKLTLRLFYIAVSGCFEDIPILGCQVTASSAIDSTTMPPMAISNVTGEGKLFYIKLFINTLNARQIQCVSLESPNFVLLSCDKKLLRYIFTVGAFTSVTFISGYYYTYNKTEGGIQ